jgi:hypothetical protein
VIDPAVDLAKGYYKWLPRSFLARVIKMTIGSDQIISDTFVIASKIQTGNWI